MKSWIVMEPHTRSNGAWYCPFRTKAVAPEENSSPTSISKILEQEMTNQLNLIMVKQWLFNTISVGILDKGNAMDFLNAIGEKLKSLNHQLRLKLKTRRALSQTADCQYRWSMRVCIKKDSGLY